MKLPLLDLSASPQVKRAVILRTLGNRVFLSVHNVRGDGLPALPGAAERRHPEAVGEHGALPQTPLLHSRLRAPHRPGARRLQVQQGPDTRSIDSIHIRFHLLIVALKVSQILGIIYNDRE